MSNIFAYECVDEGPWRYKLTHPYQYSTGINGYACEGARGLASMSQTGVIILKKGYTWNGPSGPTIDTADSIRASCVHDIGYQFLRESKLPRNPFRKFFDKLLRSIALEDKMPKWRATYWYWGVRIGARRSSFPGGGSVD